MTISNTITTTVANLAKGLAAPYSNDSGRSLVVGFLKQGERNAALSNVTYALNMMGLHAERRVGGRAKQNLWSVTEGEVQYYCIGFDVYTSEEFETIAAKQADDKRKAVHAAFRVACDALTEYLDADTYKAVKGLKSLVVDHFDAQAAPVAVAAVAA